jgi:hypothetical protein
LFCVLIAEFLWMMYAGLRSQGIGLQFGLMAATLIGGIAISRTITNRHLRRLREEQLGPRT